MSNNGATLSKLDIWSNKDRLANDDNDVDDKVPRPLPPRFSSTAADRAKNMHRAASIDDDDNESVGEIVNDNDDDCRDEKKVYEIRDDVGDDSNNESDVSYGEKEKAGGAKEKAGVFANALEEKAVSNGKKESHKEFGTAKELEQNVVKLLRRGDLKAIVKLLRRNGDKINVAKIARICYLHFERMEDKRPETLLANGKIVDVLMETGEFQRKHKWQAVSATVVDLVLKYCLKESRIRISTMIKYIKQSSKKQIVFRMRHFVIDARKIAFFTEWINTTDYVPFTFVTDSATMDVVAPLIGRALTENRMAPITDAENWSENVVLALFARFSDRMLLKFMRIVRARGDLFRRLHSGIREFYLERFVPSIDVWGRIQHARLVEYMLGIVQLDLPDYVAIWILDWLIPCDEYHGKEEDEQYDAIDIGVDNVAIDSGVDNVAIDSGADSVAVDEFTARLNKLRFPVVRASVFHARRLFTDGCWRWTSAVDVKRAKAIEMFRNMKQAWKKTEKYVARATSTERNERNKARKTSTDKEENDSDIETLQKRIAAEKHKATKRKQNFQTIKKHIVMQKRMSKERIRLLRQKLNAKRAAAVAELENMGE